MKVTTNDVIFVIAAIFAAWFAFFGMVWTYWGALFVAYPFGLISFILWRVIKSDGKKRNKTIPIILSVGLVLSLSVLVYLLIWE